MTHEFELIKNIVSQLDYRIVFFINYSNSSIPKLNNGLTSWPQNATANTAKIPIRDASGMEAVQESPFHPEWEMIVILQLIKQQMDGNS